MDIRGLSVVPYTPKTFFYAPDGSGIETLIGLFISLGRDKYVIHGSGGLVFKRPRSGSIKIGGLAFNNELINTF